MDKLIADAMKTARQTILDGGEVVRTFFAQSKNGEKHVVVAPCLSDQTEGGMVLYLKMLFAILDIEAYCMMSEVWMTVNDRGQPTAGVVRPSESPERQEALFALTVRRVRDDSGAHRLDTRSARAMITREPLVIGDVVWDEPEMVGGRLTDLLLPADMPPCPDVEGAMEILKKVGDLSGIAGVNLHDLYARPAGVSVH